MVDALLRRDIIEIYHFRFFEFEYYIINDGQNKV